jgi:tetratricopeptide (TPR) repeat protein
VLMRFRVPFVVFAIVLLDAAAWADEERNSAEHFKRGRALMAREEYGEACAAFAESQRLEPAAGTLLNLANCEEKIGKLTAALDHWRQAIAALPPRDERAPLAERRVIDLDRRLPRLTLRLERSAPTSTRLVLDDVDVTNAVGAVNRMNPGAHTVMASAEGYAASRSSFALTEGEHKELIVAPGPPVSASLPAPAEGADANTATRPSWLPPVLVGSGTALVVAGGIVWGLAKRDFDELASTCRPNCSPTQADDISTRETMSFVLFGAGAASLAIGLVVWLHQRAH